MEELGASASYEQIENTLLSHLHTHFQHTRNPNREQERKSRSVTQDCRRKKIGIEETQGESDLTLCKYVLLVYSMLLGERLVR